jgi:hypothetical protein
MDYLEKRVKEFRQNIIKKRFEYNQRNSANGIWWIIKKNLALCNEIYEISDKMVTELNSRERIKFLCQLESISDYTLKVYKLTNHDGNTLQEIIKSPQTQKTGKDLNLFFKADRSKNILLC